MDVMHWSWRRGEVSTVLAGFVAVLLAAPRAVPDGAGHLGSLFETFLPWLCLAIPVLFEAAVLRRSLLTLLSALLPLVAWLGLFGGALSGSGAAGDLTAVQHNASDENPDPVGTAKALMDAGPDLVALDELTPQAAGVYTATLGLPHHAVRGTVGLWSKHPILDARALDIRPAGVGGDWSRGLRAVVRLSGRNVAVYVAHLPSVRLGLRHGFNVTRRDESAVLLGRALGAEPLGTVILLGDLNSTVDDRGLRPVTAVLTPARSDLAFSWPAALPVARIDQVMTRAATVTKLWPLPATGSDHLPLAARITLGRPLTT
jgi:vancomycin resistance protein VanJ